MTRSLELGSPNGTVWLEIFSDFGRSSEKQALRSVGMAGVGSDSIVLSLVGRRD
jgi:hypothetical protein